VGGDVHQAGDRWAVSRFGNDRSPIAVSNKNARPVFLSKDSLRSGDICLERRLRLLDDTDSVAILDKDVVNALPARTICPRTVNQNNISDAMLSVLCRE
jgi:hypothetical protein